MRKVGFLLLFSARMASASDPPSFAVANELMGQGRAPDALKQYEACLVQSPQHALCLYNGGMAAYLSGKPKIAVDLWRRTRVVTPDDWHVRAKLVQAYQGTGDLKARDVERLALIALRTTGTDAALKKTDAFCRDQLTSGVLRAMAFEYFEPKTVTDYKNRPLQIHVMFRIGSEAGEEADRYLALASQPGAIAVDVFGKRVYTLDGFSHDGKQHMVFAVYGLEPTYEVLRRDVAEVLAGKRKALVADPPRE